MENTEWIILVGILLVIVSFIIRILYADKMAKFIAGLGCEKKVWAWCFWFPLLGGIITLSYSHEIMHKQFTLINYRLDHKE